MEHRRAGILFEDDRLTAANALLFSCLDFTVHAVGVPLLCQHFNSTDTSCYSADSNYPTLLDVVLDPGNRTIQSNTESGDSDGTIIADTFCIPDFNILEGLTSHDWGTSFWDYTSDDYNNTLIYYFIEWNDNSTAGVYLAGVPDDIAANDNSFRDTLIEYVRYFDTADDVVDYRIRYSFKVHLSDGYDSTSDVTAFMVTIKQTDSDSVLYQDVWTQEDIYNYGWNGTTVTICDDFSSSANSTTILFQVGTVYCLLPLCDKQRFNDYHYRLQRRSKTHSSTQCLYIPTRVMIRADIQTLIIL
ncbi:hypothetical protein BZA70DRAFT_270636 [Myxozyma melibiosi]|uniref:Uncharacterized protein n=1 Tax=Myxozyma melibiosi TaxID=54550 RepID=A0ABR1FDP1_9ASCO